MGNSNGKAKKAEEERLATQKRDLQEANCAAFMRANQKATDDEAQRRVEDARLARLRDAEMAERAAHLADLKEAADNKVFFNNLLEEDAKLEQEKKKAKKEKQKKKRKAEEQLAHFEEAKRQGNLEKFGFVDFPRFAVQDSDGEWFRCDLLIKAHLEQIKANKDEKDDVKARCDEVVAKLDDMNAEEMTAVMREFDMKSPIANKELSEADELLYNQRLKLIAEAAKATEEGEVEDETGQGAQATAAVLAVVNDWEEEDA